MKTKAELGVMLPQAKKKKKKTPKTASNPPEPRREAWNNLMASGGTNPVSTPRSRTCVSRTVRK